MGKVVAGIGAQGCLFTALVCLALGVVAMTPGPAEAVCVSFCPDGNCYVNGVRGGAGGRCLPRAAAAPINCPYYIGFCTTCVCRYVPAKGWCECRP